MSQQAEQPTQQEQCSEVYRTRHIALAAYLKVKGLPLLRVVDEVRGPGVQRKVFVFGDGAEARKAAFGFHDSECGLYDRAKRELSNMVYGDEQKRARKNA